MAGLIYEEIGGRRLKTSKGYRRDRKGMKLKKLKTQVLCPFVGTDCSFREALWIIAFPCAQVFYLILTTTAAV